MAMKRLYIALSLLAAAATVHADGSLTSTAVEEGGVAWSIEGVASGILSDDAAIVAQGFVVLRPGDMGGVSEIVSDSEMPEVKAYPNPVAETLVIENPSSGSYDWQICTLDGKQALNGKGTAGKTFVDCSSLTAGEYVLTVISDYGRQSAVIIKK